MSRKIRIHKTPTIYAFVDDEDYEWLNDLWCWRITSTGAAQLAKTNFTVLMHRLIMQASEPAPYDGLEVDHINGNPLDNRKGNLRWVTRSQNLHNLHGIKGRNKSGFIGVFKFQRSQKFHALITVDKKPKFLGYFNSKEQAARAYDKAALRYYGKHSHKNFL